MLTLRSWKKVHLTVSSEAGQQLGRTSDSTRSHPGASQTAPLLLLIPLRTSIALSSQDRVSVRGVRSWRCGLFVVCEMYLPDNFVTVILYANVLDVSCYCSATKLQSFILAILAPFLDHQCYVLFNVGLDSDYQAYQILRYDLSNCTICNMNLNRNNQTQPFAARDGHSCTLLTALTL